MEPRTTVVITTCNRQEKLQRAVESVRAQSTRCRLVVADCGEGPTAAIHKRAGERYIHVPRTDGQTSNLCWYVGANLTETPYVALLHDDDWYEPHFIMAMEGLLDAGAGFAISEATVHDGDGTHLNLEVATPRGLITSQHIIGTLMRMALTITPACCLFRREHILDGLMVNRIPGARGNRSLVGPDKLLLLLAAARSTRIGLDPMPLVNLDGDEGSLTGDAMREGGDAEAQLKADYQAAMTYFETVRHLV